MSRMVTLDLGQLVNQREDEWRKLRDAADTIIAKVETENREYTKEENAAITDAQVKMVALRSRVDAMKAQLKAGDGMDDPAKSKTGERDKKPSGRTAKRTLVIAGQSREETEQEVEWREAFGDLVRYGPERMGNEARDIMGRHRVDFDPRSPEARDLSSFVGVSGGYIVPPGFMTDIDIAEKDFSGVLQAPTSKIATSQGNDLAWPTVNDTTNEGELVAENTATTTGTQASGEPIFGQVTLKSYLFSSKLVLVPKQLLMDSAIDVGSLLSGLFAERLGRAKNRYYTLGTNANQPQGIVPASTLGKTFAAAAAITYGETIDLEHSVDPAYRGRSSAGYMFHDLTLALLRKLLDADGRPIWQPAGTAGMASGAPGTLNGKPYWINMSMAGPGTGNKSMLFGDFSKFKIRSVGGAVMVRLEERYAERFQVGFFLFERGDSKLVDASGGAIKHGIHP